MADDKKLSHAEGVLNASFTNCAEKENDDVGHGEDNKGEQVNQCADKNMTSSDDYTQGFFIESTSKAEVDFMNSNFVDESEFLDDAYNVEEKEDVKIDATKEIGMRDNSEAGAVPSLWTLCSDHLKIVYNGDIGQVRCVFEYMKNLYKERAINDSEIEQSEIFDILVCNKDENEEGMEMTCKFGTNCASGDEGNSRLREVLDKTPENKNENPVEMEKVIRTVFEVSTPNAGLTLNEHEKYSKNTEADKLNTSARSSTSFDSDKKSSESNDLSEVEGEEDSNSPVISLGSGPKGEEHYRNVYIVQSKKALRDMETKTGESIENTNDNTVVIKVEDTIQCDKLDGESDDSNENQVKSPELIDIMKKNTSEEYTYNESSMEEATDSQIHRDSGEFFNYNNGINML